MKHAKRLTSERPMAAWTGPFAQMDTLEEWLNIDVWSVTSMWINAWKSAQLN